MLQTMMPVEEKIEDEQRDETAHRQANDTQSFAPIRNKIGQVDREPWTACRPDGAGDEVPRQKADHRGQAQTQTDHDDVEAHRSILISFRRERDLKAMDRQHAQRNGPPCPQQRAVDRLQPFQKIANGLALVPAGTNVQILFGI